VGACLSIQGLKEVYISAEKPKEPKKYKSSNPTTGY